MRYGPNQTAVIPNSVEVGMGNALYAAADCGATWATAATITSTLVKLYPKPVNGDLAVLWNTNGTGAGRVYAYAGGAWRYAALT